MSGAGRIKGDATTSSNAYCEIKDANRSFTMNAKDLHKYWTESVRQGNDGCEMIIVFNDPPMTARVTIEKGKPV